MIVEEDGKTFYKSGGTYTRQQTATYHGKRTEYQRCSECGKLVANQWQTGHKYKYCKPTN